ncbi:MAG: NTP transferase domain-containing protein, partial [Sphingobacteriaceae bacterium]|nr:NTP transferase domain-containing protein [Cytophagaceae bacterium]
MIAAVVPAAGRSERMGRPKLILPLGGGTVIARVIRALREGGAEPIVVVAPPVDFDGAKILADEATRAGAVVVVADSATADMRASVELGLEWLRRGPAPSTVLLAPGD